MAGTTSSWIESKLEKREVSAEREQHSAGKAPGGRLPRCTNSELVALMPVCPDHESEAIVLEECLPISEMGTLFVFKGALLDRRPTSCSRIEVEFIQLNFMVDALAPPWKCTTPRFLHDTIGAL